MANHKRKKPRRINYCTGVRHGCFCCMSKMKTSNTPYFKSGPEQRKIAEMENQLKEMKDVIDD